MTKTNLIINMIENTDSYKMSHFLQYPVDTVAVSSYIEARSGGEEIVFFGLQAFIKEYLLTPITQADIDEAEELITAHGEPFNRDGWQGILEEFDGFLPITIEALPEGTVAPAGIPQVQVVNNGGSRYAWVTSYVETALLRAVWYPSTVATLSREIKKIISKGLAKTSVKLVEDQIGFKLHDFGARGATSAESSMLGGMGHLVNFLGTDTFSAVVGARRYYNEPVAGYSIPASEHSTLTSWGRENERAAMENMIDQFAGEGKIYSCVSDSYDIWNAVSNIWGQDLKEKIKASGGVLVVRPDSGDPVMTPVVVIIRLMDKFGYTTNSKGFKILPDYVRVIQGDGIDKNDISDIVDKMIELNLSIENIAFGLGGGLLQKVSRDTYNYAMKANARLDSDGIWHDVYKDPIGGAKTSKKGRLGVINQCGIGNCTLKVIPKDDADRGFNVMRKVYKNGELLVDDTLVNIRRRANTEFYS